MQTISYNLTKEKLVLLYSDCFLIPSFTSSIIWIFPGRETSYWKIRDLLKKTKLMKLLQIHPDYENLLSKFPGPLRQLLVKRLYEFELQPSDQEVQLSKGGQGFKEWETGIRLLKQIGRISNLKNRGMINVIVSFQRGFWFNSCLAFSSWHGLTHFSTVIYSRQWFSNTDWHRISWEFGRRPEVQAYPLQWACSPKFFPSSPGVRRSTIV